MPMKKKKGYFSDSSDDDDDDDSDISSVEEEDNHDERFCNTNNNKNNNRPAPLIDIKNTLISDSSSDSSDSDSDDDDDISSEAKKKKKFLKKKIQMPEPTERNPSMKPIPPSQGGRRQSLFGANAVAASTGGSTCSGGGGGGRRASLLDLFSGLGNNNNNNSPSYATATTAATNGGSGGGRRQSLFGRDSTTTTSSTSTPTDANSNNNNNNNRRSTIKPKIIAGLNRRISIMTHRIQETIRKKTVYINEKLNQIEGIEELKDLSEELKDSIWFTADEMNTMKDDMDMIAESYDAGQLVSNDNDDGDENEDNDIRGLETRTQEGKWQSYKARQDAAYAVLDEQDAILADGYTLADEKKDEELAAAYIQVSTEYLQKAQERALQDEKEALKVLAETKKEIEAYKAILDKQQDKNNNDNGGIKRKSSLKRVSAYNDIPVRT